MNGNLLFTLAGWVAGISALGVFILAMAAIWLAIFDKGKDTGKHAVVAFVLMLLCVVLLVMGGALLRLGSWT